MPLEPGKSRATIEQNIREMVNAGHPANQAVAAALHTAHYKRRAHHGGKSYHDYGRHGGKS